MTRLITDISILKDKINHYIVLLSVVFQYDNQEAILSNYY